jgi:hypothetical protein
MLLFADLPDTIEIDACLDDSARMLQFTPPSFLPSSLRSSPVDDGPEETIDFATRKRELAGRIGLSDFRRVADSSLVIDVRTEDGFLAAHLNRAVCVPQEVPLQAAQGYLRAFSDGVGHIAVLGDEEFDGMKFAESLVRAGFERVSLLNATFDDIAARGDMALCPCEGSAEPFTLPSGQRTIIRRCEGTLLQST